MLLLVLVQFVLVASLGLGFLMLLLVPVQFVLVAPLEPGF